MAYGRSRYRTRTKVMALCLVLLVLTLPLIGPFTFYASIWPHLSNILPRPEAVPEGARASYNWKASGTHWRWQDNLPSGCATWASGGDDRSYIALSFAEGRNGCEGATHRFRFFYAATPDVSLSHGSSSASSCSLHTADLADAEVQQLATFVSEAKPLAETRGERLVIAYAEQFLNQPEPGPGEHPCGGEYAERLREIGKWPKGE